MKRVAKIIIAFVVILLVITGFVVGLRNAGRTNEKILIVATNFPAYDFARAVVGDRAEIKMLVKPGVEIHDFEPTPQDMIDIKNSRMFIYTGGESDEWIKNVLDDIRIDETKIVKMMDVVDVLEEEVIDGMERDDEDKGEYDEHVWTSVRNAEKIVKKIRDELGEIMPESKDVFEGNAREYLDKLDNLDKEFQKVIRDASRKTIVFGDRFPLRYFVNDYGLEYYAAFPGCAEQTEASSETIAFLVDKVKAEGVPVVFKIEMSNGRTAETIAGETGAKVLEFNSAHNISADDFKTGLTYAEIMERNLDVLREALK